MDKPMLIQITEKPIDVFRIEHHESGLGPFEHPYVDSAQSAIRYLHISNEYMEDIDILPDVINILSEFKDKALFGWTDEISAKKAIRDEQRLNAEGFFLIKIKGYPLFINKSDNQVIFIRK